MRLMILTAMEVMSSLLMMPALRQLYDGEAIMPRFAELAPMKPPGRTRELRALVLDWTRPTRSDLAQLKLPSAESCPSRTSFGNDDRVLHGDEPLFDVAEKIKQSTVALVVWVEARIESRIQRVCEDSTTVGVDVDLGEMPLDCRDDSIRADTL